MGDQKNAVEVVVYFKEWFDEKINTILGAADSNAKQVSFASADKEFANITGRDKDMFLLGMRSSAISLGEFPISMTEDGISILPTSDSKRLEFLIENRLRVERWNTAPDSVIYVVYNDDDEAVAKDFTSREAIDLAIKKYDTAEES